jgi:hypothetical protein
MARKRPDPLFMRINREPALYEMARAVSFGGIRSGQLRERMEEMSKKHGSHAVAMAFTELTMTDPATSLTVLRPHVRGICRQFMGPPPESPDYASYWAERGREPPPEHKPPEPGKNGTAPPVEETPPPQEPEPPKRPWRYEPSDEALEAFEKLEGWMRGADDKPVDADAEDTLRVLARALLQGQKRWHHAAEARLKAIQEDPPAYVPNKDLMAFDEAIDDLLDGLHEVMFVGTGKGR